MTFAYVSPLENQQHQQEGQIIKPFINLLTV
ncbi:MAG: hypothetical protein ACJAS6_000556 [Rickettsiales bacterium]|jgi:hypothetical protein